MLPFFVNIQLVLQNALCTRVCKPDYSAECSINAVRQRFVNGFLAKEFNQRRYRENDCNAKQNSRDQCGGIEIGSVVQKIIPKIEAEYRIFVNEVNTERTTGNDVDPFTAKSFAIKSHAKKTNCAGYRQ